MQRKAKCLIAFIIYSICLATFGATLVDPTRPVVYTVATPNAASAQPLVVSAIYIHKNHRHAIVNGAIVRIGDRIGEFTITHITPYTVELMGPQANAVLLQLIMPVKQLRP